MADSKDEERDEEWFKEIYGKEYTGPARPSSEKVQDNSAVKRRAHPQANSTADESDGDEAPDPNAVPTDFTSREAKVWEAKAKAVERNWKKKKEEELTCRICGEYGHFPQGCPTTLGANRKQGEVVEKIPVKDARLKPRIIGTGGTTIQGIEKDTGCRLRLEDNFTIGNGSFFVRISGANRFMVRNAVEAVKKLLEQVQDDWKQHNPHRPQGSHNRSPNVNPLIAAQMQHIANQRMQHNPNIHLYSGKADGPYGEEQHGADTLISHLDVRRPWEIGNQNGSFPAVSYGHKGDLGSQYSSQNQEVRSGIEKGGRISKDDDYGAEIEQGSEQKSMPQNLEELEHRFVQETMELTKELNDAEDKENTRHRECMRDIQEQYRQKMVTLRAKQGKQREEFLRFEAELRHQQYQQQQQGSSFYNYNKGAPLPSFNGSALDQLGYGILSSGRDEGFGGYGLYKGEGSYFNTPHTLSRNPGYDGGMLHPSNPPYDSASYRY